MVGLPVHSHSRPIHDGNPPPTASGILFKLWGLHRPLWLYQVGMAPGRNLTEIATSKAQSTRHGPRPGLAFALWCTRGLPACHPPYKAREDSWPDEKCKAFRGKKSIRYKVIWLGGILAPLIVGNSVMWCCGACNILWEVFVRRFHRDACWRGGVL